MVSKKLTVYNSDVQKQIVYFKTEVWTQRLPIILLLNKTPITNSKSDDLGGFE